MAFKIGSRITLAVAMVQIRKTSGAANIRTSGSSSTEIGHGDKVSRT
jgi:hypothetical protein